MRPLEPNGRGRKTLKKISDGGEGKGETSVQPVRMLFTHVRLYCCSTVAARRLKPIKED